jgi:hypothetical protein
MVPEGDRLNKAIKLGQNPVLEIYCTPQYATVLVNGKNLGYSPQTYTERPGQWKIECSIPTGRQIKRVTTRDAQNERVYLKVNPTLQKKYEDQIGTKRFLMWGSLITGGLLMATSGVAGLMTKSAVSDRDSALVEWRGALTVETLESASGRFNQSNDDAMSYSNVSTLSLVGGALLLGYSAYSYLTLPSIKTSTQVKSQKGKTAFLKEAPESNWVLLPVMGETMRGVGVWFDF